MLVDFRKNKAKIWPATATAAVLSLIFIAALPPLMTKAATNPSPCPGNICLGVIDVAGHAVHYAYTEHIKPDGTLKVRLNGGAYSTGTLISYMLHDMPAFASWDKYIANPPPSGTVFLPDEDINPTNTAYERFDSDGCASCIVDQVFTVTYSGLAQGSYTFDISIFHNGSAGTLNNLTFYVDNDAPTGSAESETWAAIPGMDAPCADGVDNDINFYADCSDAACDGSVGRVSDGAECEALEDTCYDDFDNDNDGDIDCLDEDCDGKVGRTFDGAKCQYENEYGVDSCNDNFDNDGDTLVDCLDNIETIVGRSCWKNVLSGCPDKEDCDTGWDDDEDSSYSDDWDDESGTGVNCQDYDCFGQASCPSEEDRTADGSDADSQCFNGIDDDLDHLIDCADPDCIGLDDGGANPNMCFESEFDLVERYMLCNNTFNDDADAPVDCDDTDCKQRFESCGPCPAREDFSYSSCADGDDNDLDSTNDCADPDCTDPGTMAKASLGYLPNAARCALAEDDAPLCSDGWDNDTDTLIDCADDECLNQQVSLADMDFNGTPETPVLCQAIETSCGDRYDNDGDGLIDCVDGSDCWGRDLCAASWVTAACQIVPRLGPFVAFDSVDPTVTGAVTVANHVNSTDTIRLVGSGLYTSIAVVIGDNTDDNAIYPYADPTCTLTGTGSAKMGFIQVAGRVANLFNLAGQTLNGFDLTFSCPTSATPEGWRSYPISISVLKSPGDNPESGDQDFNYILYEDTPPVTPEVEVEGEGPVATLTVPRGIPRRFRIVANDPGVGINTSGICSCTIEVEGTEYDTADGTCITEPVSGAWFDDGIINVRYRAEDGVNNLSPYTPLQPININVTPRMTDPNLSVRPSGIPFSWEDSPFFREDRMDMDLNVQFEAATSDSFGASCNAVIRDADGNMVAGLPPATLLPLPDIDPIPSIAHCFGSVTIPAALPDGEYFVTVQATDSDGDTIESNRQVIYICKNKPGPGEPENVCSWADFDGDGAAEGLYSDVYAADFKACDNCVNLYNPPQIDRNANGVGEMCEPSETKGRCEFDREIVCEYDSDDPTCLPSPDPGDLCCPENPAGVDNVQQCIGEDAEFWGLCLYDYYVCFDDVECGWCEDGGVKTKIGCSDDEDCALAELSGPCLSGDGYCAGELPAIQPCRRDIDCVDNGFVGPCLEANLCDQLIFPWLETKEGNVFSQKKILAPVETPGTNVNATYCLTAEGSILNFTSEFCDLEPDANTGYERPKPDNYYTTSLGHLDIAGLLAGKYGPVHTSTWDGLDAELGTPVRLDGKVFVVNAAGNDVTITAKHFLNTGLAGQGNGTIVINGGNLIINGALTYDYTPVDRLHNLASLGWVVLPLPDGTKGNVIVNGNVPTVVGSFFIAGEEGFDSVGPPLEGSEVPFTLYGLVIARKMLLDRTLRSPDIGSERFIYDGRAVVNPPPGFADLSKSLPSLTDYPQSE